MYDVFLECHKIEGRLARMNVSNLNPHLNLMRKDDLDPWTTNLRDRWPWWRLATGDWRLATGNLRNPISGIRIDSL